MACLVLLATLGTAAVSGNLRARVPFLVPLGAGEVGSFLAAFGKMEKAWHVFSTCSPNICTPALLFSLAPLHSAASSKEKVQLDFSQFMTLTLPCAYQDRIIA